MTDVDKEIRQQNTNFGVTMLLVALLFIGMLIGMPMTYGGVDNVDLAWFGIGFFLGEAMAVLFGYIGIRVLIDR